MILAIDIGNTDIVIGGIEDRKVQFVERLSTDRTKTTFEYMMNFKLVLDIYQLKVQDIQGSIISSVVPPLTNRIKEGVSKITGHRVLVVGPGVKTGLNIITDHASALGSDLVANAVATTKDYPVPQIIIDLGTATTISVIDKHKNYMGGMIIPGIGVSLESLTIHTSQLPKISLEAPKKLIATNTIDCMKSGIIHGTASMIDGMITRIEKELEEPATIIATGGLSRSIIPHCQKKIAIDDNLLLRGLEYIYEKNTKQYAK